MRARVKANLQGCGVLGSGYDSSHSPQHGPSDLLGQHTPKPSAGSMSKTKKGNNFPKSQTLWGRHPEAPCGPWLRLTVLNSRNPACNACSLLHSGLLPAALTNRGRWWGWLWRVCGLFARRGESWLDWFTYVPANAEWPGRLGRPAKSETHSLQTTSRVLVSSCACVSRCDPSTKA